MPLVSIITPSYNQAAYLEHTIRSVLLQTGVEIEYCVVDGASSDQSLEIIQRHAGRLAWWVSEPDQGQAEAINKGLDQAQGEYVAWLNSDDLYLPGAVQKAVAAMQADPALGLVYGDAITIDQAGRPLNRLSFGNWGLLELLGFRIICQPAVFMRRSVLEAALDADQAGYLDRSYHYMLDHQLWIRMARLAPIRRLPEVLAAARQHAEAKNVKQAPAFSQEIRRILEWIPTQPDLTPLYRQNRRFIHAGAYRLQARYYLDGGQPGTALRYYAKSAVNQPNYALKHWHRMIYALLSLAGAKNLAERTLRPASARQKRHSLASVLSTTSDLATFQDWPGLNLNA